VEQSEEWVSGRRYLEMRDLGAGTPAHWMECGGLGTKATRLGRADRFVGMKTAGP
jgi:hypothetical protein